MRGAYTESLPSCNAFVAKLDKIRDTLSERFASSGAGRCERMGWTVS